MKQKKILISRTFQEVFLLLIFYILASSCFFGLVSSDVFALEKPEEDLAKAQVTTQLGAQVDFSLRFTDSNGREVALSELVTQKKPIILTPVYYSCPRLCGLVLNAFTILLNNLGLALGKDYEVLTVSFDSTETPQQAEKRLKKYHEQLVGVAEEDKKSWNFLVGQNESVEKLMKSIGFGYKDDNGEFAHSAAIMILSPTGKISQYFTDINFPAEDVRLALIEASEGKIGNAIDHFLLFCYRFDPTKGKYTLVAWNFVRLGVIFCIAISLFFVYRYGLKNKNSNL